MIPRRKYCVGGSGETRIDAVRQQQQWCSPLLLLLAVLVVFVPVSTALYHEAIGEYQVHTYGHGFFFEINGSKAIAPDRYTFDILAIPPRDQYRAVDRSWVDSHSGTTIPSLFNHQENQHFLSLPQSLAILETKKIFHILNPSFIYWNDKIVISWRFDELHFRLAVLDRAELPTKWKGNKIDRIELDLQMLRKIQFLKMTRLFRLYGEDPRLIAVGPPGAQQLYAVFCTRHTMDKPELQMSYIELALKSNTSVNGVYEVLKVNTGISIEFPERTMEDQKNWAPFKSVNPGENKIMFVASIYPHRIVKVDVAKDRPKKGVAKTVAITHFFGHSHAHGKTGAEHHPYPWEYGDLRGGTQAMLYEKNKFLSFFHASTTPKYPNITKTYSMGAYTFCAKPPYRILSYSTLPIVHESMYKGMWPDLPKSFYLMDYIVFPMSFFIVEDKIFLTYGHQDRDGWVAKMSLPKLIASLQPTNHTCV